MQYLSTSPSLTFEHSLTFSSLKSSHVVAIALKYLINKIK